MFERIELKSGMYINGVWPNNLRFADNIILFVENESKLESYEKNQVKKKKELE